MTEQTGTAAADAAQANGKTGAKPSRTTKTDGHEAEMSSAQTAEPADDECEECGEPGKAAVGLGLLICAMAGGLLYIGLDLVTGGGLSRLLGGQREEDGEGE